MNFHLKLHSKFAADISEVTPTLRITADVISYDIKYINISSIANGLCTLQKHPKMLSVKDENNVFQVYLETETGYFTDHTTLTMITSTKMATNNCRPTCSRW